MAKGDYESGVALLQQLAAEQGKTAGEALLMLGSHYKSQREDVKSAIAFYKEGLLKLGDLRGKVYFDTSTALASALVVAEDADAALAVLNGLITEYGGTTPEWTYWTGRCYLLKGDKERAYALFKEVISKHSRNPIALNASLNWARSLIEDGRNDEGLAILDKYLAAHPKTEAEIVVWKGIYLFRAKRYSEAIPLLRAALRHPKYSANEGVIMQLSMALCKAGRVDEGVRLARSMLAGSTGDSAAKTHSFIGDLYAGEKLWRDAIKAYEASLKTAGAFPDSRGYAMLRLGSAWESAGDRARAAAVYKRLVVEQGTRSTWGKSAQDRMKELEN
jgi:tetratricopeptide (TPR) repeat protein